MRWARRWKARIKVCPHFWANFGGMRRGGSVWLGMRMGSLLVSHFYFQLQPKGMSIRKRITGVMVLNMAKNPACQLCWRPCSKDDSYAFQQLIIVELCESVVTCVWSELLGWERVSRNTVATVHAWGLQQMVNKRADYGLLAHVIEASNFCWFFHKKRGVSAHFARTFV